MNNKCGSARNLNIEFSGKSTFKVWIKHSYYLILFVSLWGSGELICLGAKDTQYR